MELSPAFVEPSPASLKLSPAFVEPSPAFVQPAIRKSEFNIDAVAFQNYGAFANRQPAVPGQMKRSRSHVNIFENRGVVS